MVTGALPSGPPGYEYEIWLANALLSVTFPFLIFLAAYFGFWPLAKPAGREIGRARGTVFRRRAGSLARPLRRTRTSSASRTCFRARLGAGLPDDWRNILAKGRSLWTSQTCGCSCGEFGTVRWETKAKGKKGLQLDGQGPSRRRRRTRLPGSAGAGRIPVHCRTPPAQHRLRSVAEHRAPNGQGPPRQGPHEGETPKRIEPAPGPRRQAQSVQPERQQHVAA